MATPLAPVNLSPSSGLSIPVAEANAFTWQSDGTQAAYYLEYMNNSSEAGETYLSGWVASSIGVKIFAANTFTNTNEYKWRVRTRNTAGQLSAYSNWAVFVAGSGLLIGITFPADDYDIVTSLPLYEHTFNSPYGYTQDKFQYKVYSGLIWDGFDALSAVLQESMTWDELELYGGSLIWDSGEITSLATSIQQPPGYMITGTYWYKVRLLLTDSIGNSYSTDLRTFYILLDGIPQTPIIVASADVDYGRNKITITNPTPDPGQVSVSYNRLYRLKADGSWELIEDNITGNIGYDATCRAGTAETYAVSAVGTNGIEGGFSASATATCELSDYWFTNLTTDVTLKLQLRPEWGQMSSERKREEYQPMDSVYPVIEYDEQRFYRGAFSALVKLPVGSTWGTYISSIREVLDVGNEVLMRSPWGDIFQVDIYDFQFEPASRIDTFRKLSFNMVEVAEYLPIGSYTYTAYSASPESYWILDATTGMGVQLYGSPEWGSTLSERSRNELVGISEVFPTVNYGTKKALRGGFRGLISTPTDGTLANEIIKIRELIDSSSKSSLVFKTMGGESFYIDAYNFSFELFDRISQGRRISFEFIEIGGI